MGDTQFKITIIEPNAYVGGRCFTLKRGDRVREDGLDRHSNPFGPSVCDFDEGPGFYFNAGVPRPKFDLNDLLDSEFWKSGLFNDMYLYDIFYFDDFNGSRKPILGLGWVKRRGQQKYKERASVYS